MKQFEQWQDQIARLFPEYKDKYGNGKDRVLSQTVTFQVTDAWRIKLYMKQFEQWQDQIARLFPEYKDKYGNGKDRVLSQTVTFQVTDACDLACFAAGTKILMSDFSYKNIEDVKIGDEVLAFNEKTEKGKQIKLIPTKVTHTFYRHDFVRKIKTIDGEEIICTNEHPFLDGRRQWVRAEDINTDKKLTKFVGIDEYTPADINSLNYMIGYVISVFLGDGSMPYYKHGMLRTEPRGYQSRLAVKDIEIIERTCQYLDRLNISYTLRPFKVSTKYNIIEDAIYLNLENSLKLKNLIEENWLINHSYNYLCGFLAGIIDTEGTVTTNCTRIFNSNDKILQQCEEALQKIGFVYTYDKERQSKNVLLKTIRILNPRNTITIIRLLLIVQNAVKRKYVSVALYQNHFKRVDVQAVENLYSYVPVYNLETESHTYIANNCSVHNCSYCYQIHKGKRSMSFETAKKYIDLIVSGDKGFSDYINPQTSPGIIIEFIGGEPFLEIDLIDKICDYFTNQLIEKQHPWATKYMFSICSNGVSYFDERVQRFLRKWNGHISFSVTIDGNKELHDSCRVFPDGSPSYDLAVAAAKDWMSRGYQMGSKITIAPGNVTFFYDAIKHMIELGYTEINANCVYEAKDWMSRGYQMGSKITIAPGNVTFFYDAIKHMIELGYTEINANCVYEKGWESKHAIVLYEEMKKVSDYFLEHNLDFDHEYYCSLFNANMFHPKDEDDLQNWCFKAGTQILTPNGNKNIEDLQIGDEVISGSGQIQYVEDVKTRYATETCKVKIAGMEPMYTTPEHPILAKRFLYIGFNGKRHFSEPQWIQAKDLKKSDKIAVYKPSIGSTYIDTYLAYLVGRYIGDGWVSTTGYKLCCSYNEVNELTQILKKANIQFSSDDYRTVKQFNIFKSNTELLSILADAGKYAHGKRIPKVVFSWDKSSICAFLQGLFDADGSLDVKTKKQKFNTVSHTLVHDVSVLLRALGYFPMYYLNQRHGKHIIEGRTVNVRDRYELYYYFDPQRSKRCCIDNNENIIWTTVYSSEPSEPYNVYNLTVSKEHTFVANGVIVHNCGGNGVMLSCDPDGYLFPCIRYMESSLGSDQEPYSIGHVDIGICQTECDKCRVECLKKINRRTQSTDECFNCPIAEGCSWCSAYNYQVFGTPDARATYICIMHKARALGNIYFWNKYYRQHGRQERMKMYIPDEWALEIINQNELNMLKELSKED